eukprot:15157279-Alexandrium_andersonii.AAC.1
MSWPPPVLPPFLGGASSTSSSETGIETYGTSSPGGTLTASAWLHFASKLAKWLFASSGVGGPCFGLSTLGGAFVHLGA